MVRTRFVEKKTLNLTKYNEYKKELIRLVRQFNADEFLRICHTNGKKLKWKDVDLEPQPCHYKITLVEEEYDPKEKYQYTVIPREGTKEDPHIICSNAADEPRGTLEDPVEVSSDEDWRCSSFIFL